MVENSNHTLFTIICTIVSVTVLMICCCCIISSVVLGIGFLVVQLVTLPVLGPIWALVDIAIILIILLAIVVCIIFVIICIGVIILVVAGLAVILLFKLGPD